MKSNPNQRIVAFIFFLIFYSITNLVIAQQVSPKKAPEIVFSESLNSNIDRIFFKGKYVILDFWATWCGPCVASFPHLDSLSKKFSSDSVVFAIISSEEKNKVKEFLKTRVINAHQLLDSITPESRAKKKLNDLFGITAQSFNVWGIPHTVIIDKQQNIVWESPASELHEYDLQRILAGKAEEVMKERSILQNTKFSEAEKNKRLLELATKDTTTIGTGKIITAALPVFIYGMSAGKNLERKVRYVESNGQDLAYYYNYFSRLPFNRINNTTHQYFYIQYENNAEMPMDVFRSEGLVLLEKGAKVKFVKNIKNVDAYVMEIVDQQQFDQRAKQIDLKSKHSSYDANDKELVFLKVELNEIAKVIEDYLKVPILIDNEAIKRVPLDMILKKGGLQEVKNWLRNEYGINLKSEKRNVEFIDIIEELAVIE